MSSSARRPPWPFLLILLVALLLVPVALAVVYYQESNPPEFVEPPVEAADAATVRDFCTKCHAYPEPSSFPRAEWAREVGQAYRFAAEAGLVRTAPRQASVIKYFETNSPEELPRLPELPDSPRWPVKFERRNLSLGESKSTPIVTSAKLVALTGSTASEMLVCDMRTQRILYANLDNADMRWRAVATGSYPVRVELVDLDQNGRRDFLVSNMGVHYPSDDLLGSVVWHRGEVGGFTPITLLEGVGRVVDVKALDVEGDGKLDLLVAIYGWRKTGEIVLLRNRTTDWTTPKFVAEVIDKRHGSIELAVADLNGDGKPDFVSAFGQEHEQVVTYLNDGSGGFKSQTVYAAPLPSFGTAAFQLADLDRDGDLDIVLANGDILDPPTLLKPYHGLQWLENTGTGTAFTSHRIGDLHGVMASAVADFDGDGDLDIVGVTYIPDGHIPDRVRQRLPAVVLYEQTTTGQFTPHVLSRGDCDYLSCSAAVLPGDKLPSLLVGNGCFVNANRKLSAVSIWRNRGRP